MTVIDELKGLVPLPTYMTDSLEEFARRLATAIRHERHSIKSNKQLISLLEDAGRLAYESTKHPRARNMERTTQMLLKEADISLDFERRLLDAKAALRKYGAHYESCPCLKFKRPHNNCVCTCGFLDALKEAK